MGTNLGFLTEKYHKKSPVLLISLDFSLSMYRCLKRNNCSNRSSDTNESNKTDANKKTDLPEYRQYKKDGVLFKQIRI